MSSISIENKVKAKRLIVSVSILIPALVALLIFSPVKLGLSQGWIQFLPLFHAIVNSTTTIVLILALVAVKNDRADLHKKLMLFAFFLGALFLFSYVLYHSSVESVKYGDVDHNGLLSENELLIVNNSRNVYLGVLLSHILLSIFVVPLVLLSFYYALAGEINRHKKIVKFTYPIWLYVSITGVIVYLMISPYYAS